MIHGDFSWCLMMINDGFNNGWLVVEPPTPSWKMMVGEFVSWGCFPFPINMESHSKFQGSSHHQPDMDTLWWTNIAMENHHFKWENPL